MTLAAVQKPQGSCGDCRPPAGCLYCARLTPVLTAFTKSLPDAPTAPVPDDVVDAALALFVPDVTRDKKADGSQRDPS